jgi:hypothetical protein
LIGIASHHHLIIDRLGWGLGEDYGGKKD